MNKEPLLQNENENSIIKEKENTLEGYGNTDAFHDANFFSKLFFCWVNKVLRVKKIFKILKFLACENKTPNP